MACPLEELRVVGNHEIKDVWEDDLALKVHAILDEKPLTPEGHGSRYQSNWRR